MNILSSGRLTKKTISLVTATCAVVIGLSACGKFSAIDPKAKGTSTKANPLAADEENRLRELTASASPTPSPSPSPGQRPASGADDDRDEALDQARRIFGDELNGRTAPGTAATPAPAVAATPSTIIAGAPETAATPTPGAGPAPLAAPAPVPSRSLIAEEVIDEAKRDSILQLIEPTMRINFTLSLQRNEILALKAILDSKKELSAEQAAKLSKFKQSFLLVDADSIDALLARVDVVNATLQIAPLLLKTNWETQGQITNEEISARVQTLNTYPSDQAIRFRSSRMVMKKLEEEGKVNRTSKQMMLAELGYDPTGAKDEQSEKMLATIDEALRIMSLYPTEIDKMINDTSVKLVSEHTKK